MDYTSLTGEEGLILFADQDGNLICGAPRPVTFPIRTPLQFLQITSNFFGCILRVVLSTVQQTLLRLKRHTLVINPLTSQNYGIE